MKIYNESRQVPQDAQREIKAGRLKGFTDINPMWRIKKLTELFGACGIGWYYEITKQWLENGSDNTMVAFVNINLYFLNEETKEWSKPIEGTGGSSFISKEKNGYYTSDECYKMALTDALSVACKALGIGADVYYSKDKTKYTDNVEVYKCCSCGKNFESTEKYSAGNIYHKAKSMNTDGRARCKECATKLGTLKQRG